MAEHAVRLYLNMARSGGTLVSRCLASMEGVMLLSEIHPLGTAKYNPLTQAARWYDLFSEEDKAQLAARGESIDYLDAIEAIRARAEARGLALVLRDWSHLDFTGIPFLDPPPGRSLHLERLRSRFAVVATATVRHPVDQWLSLGRYFGGRVDFPVGTYLLGYRRFAELCRETGFVRYEDFVARPDGALEEICSRLDIPFDASWRERWADYTAVTGDAGTARDIRPLPAGRTYPPDVVAEFEASPDYRPALEALDYDPASAA